MPAHDPVPPEDMTITSVTASNGTFTASSTPWNVGMTSGNYPYNSQQYTLPIIAPSPQTYPLYHMTMEPPLTEERLRQVIREELSAYFDEGNNVLSAYAEDDTQS